MHARPEFQAAMSQECTHHAYFANTLKAEPGVRVSFFLPLPYCANEVCEKGGDVPSPLE